MLVMIKVWVLQWCYNGVTMPPAKSDDMRGAAKMSFLDGLSLREIGKRLGVSYVTISRWAKEEKWKLPKKPPCPPSVAGSDGKPSRSKIAEIDSIEDEVLRSKRILRVAKEFWLFALKGLYFLSREAPSVAVFKAISDGTRPLIAAYHEERAAAIRQAEVFIPPITEVHR
jgi:hypothetical protein